jgi:hypothetical protein
MQKVSYKNPLPKNKELWKLNRNQLQRVTGLFTGCCHLKVHLLNWDETTIPLPEGAWKHMNLLHISYVFVRH